MNYTVLKNRWNTSLAMKSLSNKILSLEALKKPIEEIEC